MSTILFITKCFCLLFILRQYDLLASVACRMLLKHILWTQTKYFGKSKEPKQSFLSQKSHCVTCDVCWLPNVPATFKCISGSDLLNFTCCHTEIEVADQTVHLIQSQYTDTGPTSPSTDPITPGTWQGSHWRANF